MIVDYANILAGIALLSMLNLVFVRLAGVGVDVPYRNTWPSRIRGFLWIAVFLTLCSSAIPLPLFMNPPQGYDLIPLGMLIQFGLSLMGVAFVTGIKVVANSFDLARRIRPHDSVLRSWIEHEDNDDFRYRVKSLIASASKNQLWGVPVYLAVAQWILLRLVTLAKDNHGTIPKPPERANIATFGALDQELALILAACISAILVGYMLPKAATMVNPTAELLRHCLDCIAVYPGEGFRGKNSISRWRNKRHRSGFLASKYLIRSLSGLSRKMPNPEFKEIDATFRKIAYLIRRDSFALKDDQSDDSYSEVCASVVALAANEDLIGLNRRAEELVVEVDHQLERPESRVAKFLAQADGAIQRHSRILIFILGCALGGIMLATGEFSKLLDFLLSVVRPG